MKKQLFAKILLLCMLCSAQFIPTFALEYGIEYKNKPEGTYSQKFSDVPSSHWAFAFIGEMQNKGIINGYPDGKFYPENYIERCEFAKIMVGVTDLSLVSPVYPTFIDVGETDWFYCYVETACPYLTGYQTTYGKYYRPNTHALREDIAVALVKLKGYDTTDADINMLETMFSDSYSISLKAAPYVATAVERGLVSGYDDGTFRGQDSITRAEASAMLWRAEQYGSDSKVTEVAETPTTTTKPVATTKPTDTPSPTATPTPTKEPEKISYPYGVKTLAKASIENSLRDMTLDDSNNLYYIDRSDNALYKINADSGKKTTVIKNLNRVTYQETKTEIETVTTTVPKTIRVEVPSGEDNKESALENEAETIEETEEAKDSGESKEPTYEEQIVYEEQTEEKEVTTVVASYSNYTAQQVYYDKTSDTVLLVGYFTEKENEQGEQGEGEFWATLDANDTDTLISTHKFVGYYGGEEDVIGSLNNGQIVVQYANRYTKFIQLSNDENNAFSNRSALLAFQKGNVLYYTSGNSIRLYNFNNASGTEVETEFEIGSNLTGMLNHSFYFWNINDGTIKSYNADMEKFRTLNVNTINGVDLEDGGYIGYMTGIILITNKESFIFYDDNAAAIRMLYKK